MVQKISSKTFSGAKRVHDGTLAAILREQQQYTAAVLAKAVADITDSSTGTSGGATIAAIPLPAAFTSVGTDAAPKAGTETALALTKSAVTTLVASANAIAVAIGLPVVTAATGGTDGAGTVAAQTKTVTAVAGTAGTGINAVGGLTVLTNVRSEILRTGRLVNEIRVATGLAPLTLSIGGEAGATRNFAALAVDTGTAATSGQAAALGTFSKTAVDAYLLAAANAVAGLAAGLNAATSDARTIRPTVYVAA